MIKNKNLKKGFTLIELLVTISISVMIMGVVLFSYSTFQDKISLSSASQEISIAIRQAQVYGLSVKEKSIGSGDFSAGYGIYFSQSDPQKYYIFSDSGSSSKGIFDGGGNCSSGGDCIVETGNIKNGVKISSICGTPLGGSSICPPSYGLVSLNAIFPRPKTIANIRFSDSSFGSMSGLYQAGTVVLTSPQGNISRITIENMGQISVQ